MFVAIKTTIITPPSIMPLSISAVQVDKAYPIRAAGIIDRKTSMDFTIMNTTIVVPIKCKVLHM